MREENLLITNLQREIRQGLREDYQLGIEIFCFGSVLHKAKHKDIDLLIVYDKNRIDVSRAIQIRKRLVKVISRELEMNTDICLLSKEEDKQSRFSESERARKLSFPTIKNGI